MKYYIGYFDPCDWSTFQVIAATPTLSAAYFVLTAYLDMPGVANFVMLTAAEILDKTLRY